jgi:alanine dehydrogenase
MGVLIDHERVPQLISMDDAIEILADAYRQLGTGRAIEADRTNLMLPHGWIRVMPAALLDDGLSGYKEFHRFHGHARFAIHLFDAERGDQVALLDGRYLTALRTGACGGLAVKLLAPPDATVLGVIGSGAEARQQVRGILAVRDITTMYVYSRTPANREAFCREFAEATPGLRAIPVDEPVAAIEPAEILAVATRTGDAGPALMGRWLPRDRRLHINSVCSTLPSQRELAADAWGAAACVVLDSESLLQESGDAIAAREAGVLDGQQIITLAQLVAGSERPAPGAEQGITLYKSTGSPIQDLAVAVAVYRNALASGEPLPELPDFQSVRSVASA